MRGGAVLCGTALMVLVAADAHAGFTETVPEGIVLLDVSYSKSWLNNAWNNDGELGPLIDEIWRYEPGGGLQGVIIPEAKTQYDVLIGQLQLGIFDQLTVGVGVPLVLETQVEPSLKWHPGDYQASLGRPYSDEDFWAWAASMGQPKPGPWTGNKGKLSDIILGLRYRFTDGIDWMNSAGLASAVMVMGAIPTGEFADPEEIVAAGTTMWELHSQGDLSLHLGIDKTFQQSLDDRLRLGVDFFYDAFFERTYDTPRGTRHPLLLNYQPYVGDTYELDPGDFVGASFQADVVPWRGPAWGTWITDGDAAKAETLPPLVTVSARYTYTHIMQSDWTSDSDLWDWDREKLWRPGYKNVLFGRVAFGLLRLGIPAVVYGSYRSLTLLPGKNTRAANVLSAGIQIPLPLW